MSQTDDRRQLAVVRETMGDGPRVPEVRDLAIPTAEEDLRARLYRVTTTHPPGVWIWFHAEDLEGADPVCRLMARASGCDVLSVACRLAPDAYCVVEWAARELAQDLPLVVGGESAGGALAAAAALQARGADGPSIAAQVLVHPLFDADVDMSGLPATTVVLAELDPLREEDAAYARRLEDAGVDVATTVCAGLKQGFWCWANRLDRGRAAVEDVCARLRRTLAPTLA